MEGKQDHVNQLAQRLDALIQQHGAFAKEIASIKAELQALKDGLNVEKLKIEQKSVTTAQEAPSTGFKVERIKPESPKGLLSKKLRSQAENFIGTNLSSIVGAFIIVIGVGIGVKYAIDKDLISPVARIILGYLFGAGMLFTAIRLKSKYHNFSAILLSGALAIFYFVTYAAFLFFQLIPQFLTFGLMTTFTAFTVLAAITYDRQVIAHFGLVGAYAVPLLLGGEPDQTWVLFLYMGIVNVGILIISFQRYWKSLYYVSFLLTWLIYSQWYFFEYQSSQFGIGFTFLVLFFGIFYLTFLAYKLLQKEQFRRDDILLLLLNAFIFFGVGYGLIDKQDGGDRFLGLFALLNAIIHFGVSLLIYRQKLADRNLLYFIVGLVLVFITLAIPIQLKGKWVTLLWMAEATLLFWIGRSQSVRFYERFSYPLIGLAFFSLLLEWSYAYEIYTYSASKRIMPIFNVHFLTSTLFMAAFGFMTWLNWRIPFKPIAEKPRKFNVISFVLPAIFLFISYNAFRLEIGSYWDQLYQDSYLAINENGDDSREVRNRALPLFRYIWVLNYTFAFLIGLIYLNGLKIKSTSLGIATLIFSTLALLVFLFEGLNVLSSLRNFYLDQSQSSYFNPNVFYIGIRYILFGLVGVLFYSISLYLKDNFNREAITRLFDLTLHFVLLFIASSELINWLNIASRSTSIQLSLSILWGSYALGLIVLGIWRRKQHLRMGAIVLFGITLAKLFFYDLNELDTISKTVVFVSLGILLLVISYLYNKYNSLLDDAET